MLFYVCGKLVKLGHRSCFSLIYSLRNSYFNIFNINFWKFFLMFMLHWIIVTNFVCSCSNFAIAVCAYCYIFFGTEFEYFFTNHSNGFIIFTLFCIVALSYSADRKPLFFFINMCCFQVQKEMKLSMVQLMAELVFLNLEG